MARAEIPKRNPGKEDAPFRRTNEVARRSLPASWHSGEPGKIGVAKRALGSKGIYHARPGKLADEPLNERAGFGHPLHNKGDEPMTYNDPQEVHSGTCDMCGQTVRDNEQDLFPHGRLDLCASCFEEACEQDDEEARAEKAA